MRLSEQLIEERWCFGLGGLHGLWCAGNDERLVLVGEQLIDLMVLDGAQCIAVRVKGELTDSGLDIECV